jgi:CreA protein
MNRNFCLMTVVALVAITAHAQEIGGVNTEWKLFGSHQLVVEAYDDPKVEGIACYVSKPKRGGIAGAAGVAEEVSDVSITCRQTGPIRIAEPLPQQEDAFTERRSILFKTLHVVRMVDVARNTLVYLTYTDKLIHGSPKNSIAAVPIGREMPIPLTK